MASLVCKITLEPRQTLCRRRLDGFPSYLAEVAGLRIRQEGPKDPGVIGHARLPDETDMRSYGLGAVPRRHPLGKDRVPP